MARKPLTPAPLPCTDCLISIEWEVDFKDHISGLPEDSIRTFQLSSYLPSQLLSETRNREPLLINIQCKAPVRFAK